MHTEPQARVTVIKNHIGADGKGLTIFNSQPIKSKSYEKIRWPYYLSLPLMWLLTAYVMLKKQVCNLFGLPSPRTNTFFFDGMGLACRKVKEYATTWRAMEIIYNHVFPQKLILGGILDEFYWHGMNCQALRNRYKLVKKELHQAILGFAGQKEVRLMSLACGAGQAVIEVVAEFKLQDIFVKTILVDLNADALEHAKKLAEAYNVLDRMEFCQANIDEESQIFQDFKPQIVEMLGYLDYVNQDEAIRFVKKIYDNLPPNGILITCNIAPNVEQYFLKWVINWPMVYRRPEELLQIGEKSGFSDYRAIYEPMKIHGLLIAKK